jgi:filamentous hemagglutinin family protein
MNHHSSMNRIYRLVWSQVRSAWVPVAETARARGKCGRARAAARVKATSGAAMAACALALGALAQAGPTGGQIVGGQGTISQSGNSTNIHQSSENLSINWLSFNVGANETVDFIQPNASAIAVNRIGGLSGSEILGHLDANGQVYLINPNGVVFGEGAQVNVGGLVASALDLSDASLAGSARSFAGTGAGSVLNEGTISAAPGGYVALLGNHVSNQGVVTAQLGTVALGAGNAVTLTFNGNSLVHLQVDGNVLGSLAANGGLMEANGGQVIMTAGAKDALLASVVNNTGVIEARTVDDHQGTITLLGGMQAGTVNVGGTLDASAPNEGNGGFIETSAAHVEVADGARVTTQALRGRTGGWLIDPTDFTVAPSGGDITGATLSSDLNTTNFTILSSTGESAVTGGGSGGNINVNDTVSWSANTTLTLTAANNVNVNGSITAAGSGAGIIINPNTANGSEAASGTGAFNLGAGATINLPTVSPTSTTALIIGGIPYTVINTLGSAGSTTGTDLQGISGNLSGHFALGSNLNAAATATWNSGAGFTPIGSVSTPFVGTLNGLGHTVSGLTVDRPSSTGLLGLFGVAGSTAVMTNLGLIGGSVSGGGDIGMLVGLNYGTVTNSYSTGSVSGVNVIGGLVGYNDGGMVSTSYATGPVSGDEILGGLVGYTLGGTISNSHATGTVTGSGNVVGGLVGGIYGDAVVSNSYATGAVSGNDYVAGLAGNNYGGAISNSYAKGNVNGQEYVGGLVGYNYGGGTISNTFATGVVSGGNSTGGLVGYNTGTISNSYATGNVSGGSYVGGLVGYNTGAISFSYGTGSVTGYQYVGGLAGWNYGGPVSINNSYATGSVNGSYKTGGLVGANYIGTIINSYATGSVSVTGFYVGGLVGYNTGVIGNSYASGPVSGEELVGGLVGFSSGGEISTSYAIGNVNGIGAANSSYEIGGLVGQNSSLIIYSYAKGNVSGSDTGSSYVGGLVGQNGAVIENSYATGSVSGGTYYVGGLVGENDDYVINSHATGSVNGYEYVGGLVGRNYGSYTLNGYINNSYATGNVTGTTDVGGLVGYNYGRDVNNGIVTNSYATGNVTGTNNVGGLVGLNSYGTVGNSYATGSVGGSNYVGGLLGWNRHSPVSNSYATGSVSGYSGVGGLAGANYGATISNSYATGSVTGTEWVGGLVGANAYGTVANSYAAGRVSGTSYVGGLVGYSYGAHATNSFWDTTTTGQTTSPGGGSGMSTANMQNQANFTSATSANGNVNPNWDFTNTWVMYSGYTYPLLRSFMTPLTVTANSGSVTYNGSAYSGALGVTYSTPPNANLLGTLTFNGPSGPAVNAGSYVITPGGLYSNQQGYIISYASAPVTITRLASVTWTGGASGNWSTASNWAGGAIPDYSNVAAVTIPAGVTVTYDSGVPGATKLSSLTSSGNLIMTAGKLDIAGSMSTAGFEQTGGKIDVGGSLSIQAASGGVALGNITTGELNVDAPAGAITQLKGSSIDVSGATDLNAGTDAITLTSVKDDFTGAVTAEGGAITLKDATALTATVDSSGAVSLTSAGALDVSGTIGTTLTTVTTGGAGSTTTFGDTTVGKTLKVTSTGAVATAASDTLTVDQLSTTVPNKHVTVNGTKDVAIPVL